MTRRRIVARAPATLSVRVADGVVAVSATVTDLRAGAKLLDAAQATVEGGVATVEVTATMLPQPTWLEVVWDFGSDHLQGDLVDVAGGRYTTPHHVRGHQPDGHGVNRTRFSDELLEQTITVVEDRIDRATRVAWVPRYGRWRLSGRGLGQVEVPAGLREILSATIDGEGVPDGELDRWRWSDHILDVGATRWLREGAAVDLEVIHGRDLPPADLADAAVEAVRSLAATDVNSRVPRTAESMSGGGIAFNFTHQADLKRGRPFGLPDVDSVVMSHQVGEPAVA